MDTKHRVASLQQQGYFFAWNTLFLSSQMYMGYKLFENLGMESSLWKATLGQNSQGAGLGNTQQNWDSQLISAVVEANNFKFGIQFGLGELVSKTNF